MSNVLEIKDLSVCYRMKAGGVRALDAVSFEVERGEVFGVVGESGSGKSTLAYSILGVYADNAQRNGSIVFQGRDIVRCGERALQSLRGSSIGFIAQDPASAFNPVFTVGYQFREFIAVKLGVRTKADSDQLMVTYLKKVRVNDPRRILACYPHQLSGGLLQRAMIAIMLSAHPALLIADEPTSSLDVTIESQIINLFRDIQKELGLTVIFITHNLDLVNIVCDRVMVLHKGKVVDLGDSQRVMQQPQSSYTRELIRAQANLESDVA